MVSPAKPAIGRHFLNKEGAQYSKRRLLYDDIFELKGSMCLVITVGTVGCETEQHKT